MTTPTPPIETTRLILVPYTVELLQAEIASSEQLAAMLGAQPPPSWPPPLNDEDSQRYFLSLLQGDENIEGWCGWYVLKKSVGKPHLVANGGYKGAPGVDGFVEIGYSVIPDFQRQGIATEMVHALCNWAFAHEAVTGVFAHTLLDDVASSGVLSKCGFNATGTASEDGMEVRRHERRRI